MLQGRGYVTPQDVKSIGPDVLRHRIILTYEAEAEGVTTDAIIKKIFDTMPVPLMVAPAVEDFDASSTIAMTLTELLETVRRVEVRTNRLVNDTMVGAYLSHFKGRGMDFEELREYIPGDDVRDIDWNVTHRMGRPFVKRFREERELTAVLAVDVSASSSAFGSAQPHQARVRRRNRRHARHLRRPQRRQGRRCCSSPTRWNCSFRRAKAAATSCASSAKC